MSYFLSLWAPSSTRYYQRTFLKPVIHGYALSLWEQLQESRQHSFCGCNVVIPIGIEAVPDNGVRNGQCENKTWVSILT